MFFYWIITGSLLAVMLFSHLGRWVPAADAAAVGRPVLVGLAASATLGGHVFFGVGLAWSILPLLSALSIAWALWRWPRPAKQLGLRLYQKNLLYSLPSPEPLLEDIHAMDPDVITLQEVSAHNQPVLDGLAAGWPHRQETAHPIVGRIVVLSRLPCAEGPHRLSGPGHAALRVRCGAVCVWVMAVHLPWPWPFELRNYLGPSLAAVQGLDGARVVAGDFNIVPWAWPVHAVAQALGGRRAGRGGFTFPFGPIALPIDHVIAPGGGRIAVRPLVGSDHRGVVADI